MRNSYEGTPFDLTQGLAAGAFASPSRWSTPQTVSDELVCWERSIATYKSIVSLVAQSRSWLPDEVGGVLWFSNHCAKTSFYSPFAVGQQSIPSVSFSENSLDNLGRNVSAYWAAKVLFNVAELKQFYMIEDIRNLQDDTEGVDGSEGLQKFVDDKFVSDPEFDMADVEKMYNRNAINNVVKFWKFSDQMLMNYADGYCDGCGGDRNRHLGYPQWWLDDDEVYGDNGGTGDDDGGVV